MRISKILLLIIIGIILKLSVVYSLNCIEINTNNYIIKDNSQCYYIYNKKNMYISCSVPLNSSNYYDIIIKNSKNITLDCTSFKNILVYNSSDIRIGGIGILTIWSSSNISSYKNNFVGIGNILGGYNISLCKYIYKLELYNFTSIICTNIFLRIKMNITSYQNRIGYIKLDIANPYNYSIQNLKIGIKSDCIVDIIPINASIPAVLGSKYIIINNLDQNSMVTLYFKYIIKSPNIDQKCKFYTIINSELNLNNINKKFEDTILVNSSTPIKFKFRNINIQRFNSNLPEYINPYFLLLFILSLLYRKL